MPPRDESAADNPTTSTHLLSRARKWDQDAWNQIVRQYGPLVYRWSQRWPLQPADREDLFQEIFRSVADGLPRFSREKPGHSFRSWLWTLTRNRAADLLRRQNPVGALPDESGIVDHRRTRGGTGTPTSDPPLQDYLANSLEKIQPEFHRTTWRAFWESVIEQRPPADVAQELGLSLNSVYHARSRVLARLRVVMSRAIAVASQESIRPK